MENTEKWLDAILEKTQTEVRKMIIYTIRHGETEGNAEGRLQGWVDGKLNENGIALAKETAAAVKAAGIHFDECFSSPLSRAADTAHILLSESGNENVPVHYDERLKEADVGGWDNMLMTDVKDFMWKYLTDPFGLTKEEMRGGETMRETCSRTQSFLKELIARNDDRTYLVSTHGCAVRAMCDFLYDDNSRDFWRGMLPLNCSMNIIEVKDGKAVLLEQDHVWYDRSKSVDHYSIGRFQK